MSLAEDLEYNPDDCMGVYFEGDDERVWYTRKGDEIPYKDLENNHLKNIINYLDKKSISIPPNLEAEAKRRGIDTP